MSESNARQQRGKHRASTTEEKRVELVNKVAELRLNPDATRKADIMAWRKIREHEDVRLLHDEFHKGIRVSPYYKEAMLKRLDSLIDEGWVYKSRLDILCGVDVPEEFVERMKANKGKSEPKDESNSDGAGGTERKRDNVVMVRVDEENLNRIDELVETGQFSSRSEATAFLISEGIKAKQQMFEKMAEKVSQIQELRTELEAMIAEDTKASGSIGQNGEGR